LRIVAFFPDKHGGEEHATGKVNHEKDQRDITVEVGTSTE
jgi:hypothetical protein